MPKPPRDAQGMPSAVTTALSFSPGQPPPSPFNILSVLKAEERSSLSWMNMSFHRPATEPAEGLPAQAVPRHIVQTGASWIHANGKHHAAYIRSWLELNPEYEYSFFGDEHARRFMKRHGTPREWAAYRRILTGSQRADLFRVVFLKVAGGVYADLDEELQKPMRELIGGKDMAGRTIPRSSSAVIGMFWPFEFLVFAPQHPIMVHTAWFMSEEILKHVGLQRNQSSHACKTPHECVIRVTGPLAYTSGVGEATHAPGGCRNRPRTPRQSDCSTATNALKSIFLCDKDEGTIWNTWSCGFARHWDCRNSIKRRACPTKHYARTREFFDLRDIGDGAVV